MVVVAENNYFKNNKYPPTHTHFCLEDSASSSPENPFKLNTTSNWKYSLVYNSADLDAKVNG